MPGERTPDTSAGPSSSSASSDNDISLREHMQRQIEQEHRYFERLMGEFRTQLDERYATQTTALDAAFQSLNSRFESVNEFRGQLNDQAQRLMARSEADARLTALSERLDEMNRKMADLELRVQSRLDLTQGSATGLDKAWGYLIGMVGLVGGVIGLILALTR